MMTIDMKRYLYLYHCRRSNEHSRKYATEEDAGL